MRYKDRHDMRQTAGATEIFNERPTEGHEATTVMESTLAMPKFAYSRTS